MLQYTNWNMTYMAIVFLLLTSLRTQVTGTFNVPQSTTPSKTLKCHDCAGHSDCETLINHNWTGKCTTGDVGKCFIRKDPNAFEYRGCADTQKWPLLDYSYTGCRYQRYGWWDKTPVLWCFCDIGLCNTNISAIARYYGQNVQMNQQKQLHPQPNLQPGPQPIPQPNPQPQPTDPSSVQQWNLGPRIKVIRVKSPVDKGTKDYLSPKPLPTLQPQPQPQPQPTPHPPLTKPADPVPNPGIPWETINGFIQKMKERQKQKSYITKSLLPPTPLPPVFTQKPTPTQPSIPLPSPSMKPTTLPPDTDFSFPPYPNWYPGTKHPGFFPGFLPPGTKAFPVIPFPYPWIIPYFPMDREGPKGKGNGNEPTDGKQGNGNGIVLDPVTCATRGCDQTCEMNNGSPVCSCRPGYTLQADRTSCTDVNECTLGRHQCSHTCLNTAGSYVCACRAGFTLDRDGVTCYDENECNYDNGACAQECVNTAAGYECRCREGYQLNVDRHSCDDVNECGERNGGCAQTCFNTEGSYTCGCLLGYELEADGHNCKDINECVYQNGGCAQRCQNVMGSYRCGCNPGYNLNPDRRLCDRVEQCNLNNGGCEHFCEDRLDGPVCRCQAGYQLSADAKHCFDVNECLVSNGGCSHYCNNTLGSYYCYCRQGYQLNVDSRTCYDQNECLLDGIHGCAQGCINVDGSYRCSCRPGYTLNTADQRTCDDNNECYKGNGGCTHRCENTPGSYRCSCLDDMLYKLDADQRTCIKQCPTDFHLTSWGSCYKVFTAESEARTVVDARAHCKTYHPGAELITIDTIDEKEFVAALLANEGVMLDRWQGWWTSGAFKPGPNQFEWVDGTTIDLESPFWGFLHEPYKDTCVWILQPSYFDFLWGNYDCESKSGFVCEIEIPNL